MAAFGSVKRRYSDKSMNAFFGFQETVSILSLDHVDVYKRQDHPATLKFSRNQCPAKAGIERPVMFLKSLLHIVEELSLIHI